MTRAAILCEGQTEAKFVNAVLAARGAILAARKQFTKLTQLMRPTLQDLVKTLESLPPDDRQTYIEDFLAQIEDNAASELTQPASLRDVYEGALQQIARGQTMKMEEFCARASKLNVGSDAIGTD